MTATPEATRASRRSKNYGYQVEVAALAALKDIFPRLRRVGSVAFNKAGKGGADLEQAGITTDTLRIVATRDKRQPVLVTLSASDLLLLLRSADAGVSLANVVVQCKGRQSSLIGRWWRELWEASRG